jgi:hypothetical protein
MGQIAKPLAPARGCCLAHSLPGLGDDHGANQVVDQRVVITPTADAIKPALEQLELTLAKLGHRLLQQQYGETRFFEHLAGEEPVGHLQQGFEAVRRLDLAAGFARVPPQIGGVPSVRADFFLEEPLHAFGMLGRAPAAEVGSDLSRPGVRLGHALKPRFNRVEQAFRPAFL